MMARVLSMGAWFQGLKESEDHEKVGVVKALRKVWPKVPTYFGSRHVKRLVEKETGKNYMDSTVTRKMRYLRGRGEIGYECTDIQRSTYIKLF